MKKFIVLAIVAVIALITFYILSNGIRISENSGSAGQRTPETSTLSEKYRLLIGKPFPTAELLDSRGARVLSSELLSGGKVVLFLEPGCNNCDAMIEKWKALIDKRTLGVDEIFGISFMAPNDVGEYRKKYDVPFPIYSDTSLYFLKNHQIDQFPLQLVVGKSGIIHQHTYKVSQQIFPDQLNRWFDE